LLIATPSIRDVEGISILCTVKKPWARPMADSGYIIRL
jgi:hypothetical protein